MLSFEKGIPIAKIKGGKYDKEILHIFDPDIHKDEEKKCKKNIPFDEEILHELLFSNLRGKGKVSMRKIKSLLSHLEKDVEPVDDDLSDLFFRSKSIKTKKKDKELILHDGELIPIPDPNAERLTYYISGPSGAGKSTYIANLLKQYQKIHPDKKIILFSRKDEDDAFNGIKMTRILMDEDLIKDPINPKELKNSIVVFDDTDTLPNKLRLAVDALKDDVLQIGRSLKIDVIITSHNITNYKQTRTILQETKIVTIFPKAGISRQIRYFLGNYLGLKGAEVERILKLPSRWVSIYMCAPQTLYYAKGAYILN